MTSAPTPPSDPVSRPAPSRIACVLFHPVLAPILRRRDIAIGFSAVALVQVAAGLLHFRTIDCPMLKGTGLPCPGCGLSRACAAICRGAGREALTVHAFSPLFLVAAAIMAISVMLPAAGRERWASWVEWVERRSGVVPLVLAGFFVYWAWRLVYLGAEYVVLMRG